MRELPGLQGGVPDQGKAAVTDEWSQEISVHGFSASISTLDQC